MLEAIVLGLIVPGTALAEDAAPSATPEAVRPERYAIDFLLTRDELRRIALRHSFAFTGTEEVADDGVTVTAPRELLPMRDVTQEVWGGPAAPVWALLHPKEAWRIFLPIPPKD
jgi:hypothetical protein